MAEFFFQSSSALRCKWWQHQRQSFPAGLANWLPVLGKWLLSSINFAMAVL